MVINDVVLTVAGFIGAITVIVGGLLSIYKIARRLDAAVGADSDGRTVAERLTRVEHQLWENGGSSLADRVNRIEDLSKHTATEVGIVKEILINSVVAAPIVQPTPQRRTRRKTTGTSTAPAFGLSVADVDNQ